MAGSNDNFFDALDASRRNAPMPDFQPVPHSPGMSLEDQMMAVEAAKIARYMQFAQPALNSLIPAFDRVERNVNQLTQKIESLTFFVRATALFVITANAVVLAYFYFAFYRIMAPR